MPDDGATTASAHAAPGAFRPQEARSNRRQDMPLPPTAPWQGDGSHRIPFGVYTDAALHQRELDRFFYRDHWCYVGL
ncbi:MAG: salicylate hydroxylase, partial [Achromobacter pestifer]